MQDKKRVENFWREPPRGLFIHFVLLIKKRRLKSSQKSLTFWGHYSRAAGVPRYHIKKSICDSLPSHKTESILLVIDYKTAYLHIDGCGSSTVSSLASLLNSSTPLSP